MGVLDQSPFKKDEAEFLRDSLTARKRSLLPIGNFYTILCIFIGKMVSKHTKKIVFQSMMKTMIMMMKKKITKKMKRTKTIKKGEVENNEIAPSEVF